MATVFENFEDSQILCAGEIAGRLLIVEHLRRTNLAEEDIDARIQELGTAFHTNERQIIASTDEVIKMLLVVGEVADLASLDSPERLAIDTAASNQDDAGVEAHAVGESVGSSIIETAFAISLILFVVKSKAWKLPLPWSKDPLEVEFGDISDSAVAALREIRKILQGVIGGLGDIGDKPPEGSKGSDEDGSGSIDDGENEAGSSPESDPGSSISNPAKRGDVSSTPSSESAKNSDLTQQEINSFDDILSLPDPDIVLGDGRKGFSLSADALKWSNTLFDLLLRNVWPSNSDRQDRLPNFQLELSSIAKSLDEPSVLFSTGVYVLSYDQTPQCYRIAIRVQSYRNINKNFQAVVTKLFDDWDERILTIGEWRQTRFLEASGYIPWNRRRRQNDPVHIGADVAIAGGPSSSVGLIAYRTGDAGGKVAYALTAGHGVSNYGEAAYGSAVFHPTPRDDADSACGEFVEGGMPPRASLQDLSEPVGRVEKLAFDVGVIRLESGRAPVPGSEYNIPGGTIKNRLSPYAYLDLSRQVDMPPLVKVSARSPQRACRATAFGANIVYRRPRSGDLRVGRGLIEFTSEENMPPIESGDSGGLVVDSQNRPVGLVVAGTKNGVIRKGCKGVAYATPLGPVIDHFELSMY